MAELEVGDLCWAFFPRYPPWPAQVLSKSDGNKIRIRSFGDDVEYVGT